MELNLGTLIPVAVSLFIAGGNCAIFLIIKFNDLVHLEKKLDKFSTQLDKIDEKLDISTDRISKIEGKCTANHG